MNPILELNKINKYYQNGDQRIEILSDISFSIQSGETVSIVGPSGSGKTTLLGLCAGLDKPSSGQIFLNNIDISNSNESQLARIRNQHVGFIFQNFQLLPTLTAIENVMLPLELQGDKSAKKVAQDLLFKVGLDHRKKHYPTQLSGGEQQRVALARAFANSPKILFADEPTGNLDADTSLKVEELLFSLNSEKGTTLVVVTHDLELARKTDRIITIKGGSISK